MTLRKLLERISVTNLNHVIGLKVLLKRLWRRDCVPENFSRCSGHFRRPSRIIHWWRLRIRCLFLTEGESGACWRKGSSSVLWMAKERSPSVHKQKSHQS